MGKSLKERLYERDGKKCHYCHIEEDDFIPIWGPFYNNQNRGPTLEKDRKDNNQGHILANCVLACALCNNAKTDKLSECEMMEVGKVIEKIWKQRKYYKKLAILAPVPQSFLRTAIYQIYPIYKKVAFGANKVEEMQTIRDAFLDANKNQVNVRVYVYEGGYIRYEGILIDEFRFYNQITAHPDPWGSWNISFKSYYTIKDINACKIPLNKFRSFLTGKIIGKVRRPLRVIDP